jgi:hypothetical protein
VSNGPHRTPLIALRSLLPHTVQASIDARTGHIVLDAPNLVPRREPQMLSWGVWEGTLSHRPKPSFAELLAYSLDGREPERIGWYTTEDSKALLGRIFQGLAG